MKKTKVQGQDSPLLYRSHQNSANEEEDTKQPVSPPSTFAKILTILCSASMTLFLIVALLFIAIVAGLGSYAFDQMFLVDSKHTFCPMKQSGNATTEPKSINNPSHFYNPSRCPLVNATLEKYWFPDDAWEVVKFQSRDPEWIAEGGGNLEGYLFQQPNNPQDYPFAIGIHGWRVCKRNYAELFMANVLWRNGYNVLMLDLRNHGNSDANPKSPYATFGSEEHKDALGALDYLTKRFPWVEKQDVGLFGCSMGGASVLVTLAKEPRFKAAWADSPACDVLTTFQFGANRETPGAGGLVISLAATMAPMKSIYGFPPFRNNPLQLVETLDETQHVFFVHGTQDIIVPVQSSYNCVEAMKKSLAANNIDTFFNATYWEPVPKEDAARCDGHCQMMMVYPELYAEKLIQFFDKTLKKK